MSNFPTSVGLPASLDFSLPPSVTDETRSYEISIAPDGTNSVTCPGITTVHVLNSTCAQSQFNAQMITFSIPSGHSDSVFLDPTATVLQGRLAYTVGTASNVTDGKCNLIGGFSSLFESLTLTSNNTPIEQVANYGPLFNQLMSATVNLAERAGGISIAAGADNSTTTGVDITVSATGTRYMNFSIPLLSIIGLNTKDKLFPIGSCGAMSLALQTVAILPIATHCSALTTAGAITAITLDSMTLNLKYVDIGHSASAALRSGLPGDSYFLKSTSYVNSNYTIPNGSSGNASCLLQIRNTSVKSIFGQFGSSAPTSTHPNMIYDAFNPALTSLQLSIAGWKRPQRPLNPLQRPAESFTCYMSAHGAASLKSYGGTINRSAYGATLPLIPAGSDNMMTLPLAGLRPYSSSDTNAFYIASDPHAHYIGFDCDRIDGGLFSGTNTRMSPPFVDVFLATAMQETVQLSAWALIDVIVEINVPSKTVTVYN